MSDFSKGEGEAEAVDLRPEALAAKLRGEMTPLERLVARMDDALEYRKQTFTSGEALVFVSIIEEAAKVIRSLQAPRPAIPAGWSDETAKVFCAAALAILPDIDQAQKFFAEVEALRAGAKPMPYGLRVPPALASAEPEGDAK